MHPQIKIVGETADGTIKAIAVNPDGSLVTSGGGSGGGSSGDASAANQLEGLFILSDIRDRLLFPSNYEQVMMSVDLTKTFTYLDVDSADERISSVLFSSQSLAVEFLESYVYSGTPGNYRLINVTRVQQFIG